MNGLFAAAGAVFLLAISSAAPSAAWAHADLSSRAPGAVGARDITPTQPIPRGAPSFPNEGWASRTGMPAGRWAHAMASYSTGTFPTNLSYVYAISGADASFNNTDAMSRYDVNLDLWESMAPMPTSRTQVSAARIGDRIYVPGGYGGSFSPVTTLSIYDISTNTWSLGAPLLQATGDYAIGTYADRYIYVIGGYSGSGDLSTVQVYDSVDDSWQVATPKIGVAVAGLRGGIVDDRIVVAGGYSQVLAATQSEAIVGTIDPGDPAVIAWSIAAPYPGGPSGRLGAGTPVAVGPSAGTDALNAVLFTGGDPNGQGIQVLASTWLYDFNDDTWKLGPSRPTAVSNIGNLAGVASGGKMHMVSTGGYNGTSVVAINEWLTFGEEVPPDLGMTLAADNSTIVPGGSILYTIDYMASGVGITTATVTETVPPGTVFVAADSSPGWVCAPDENAGSVCTADLGTLAAGDAGSLEFAVDSVYPVPPGITQIENSATISSSFPETDESNNGASAITLFTAGAVSVSPTSGLSTSEAGASVQFEVTLLVPPLVDVTIDFVSSDPSEGSVSPASLLFTPADWNVVQTVTVTGIGDDDEDGDVDYSIIGNIASGAGNYEGVGVASVTLTNVDSLPVPPAVTGIGSVRDTGDGVLLAGEVTSVPITQLIIDFSEPLDDSGGAPSDLANYRLVAAGPDGVLESADCAGTPTGDDVIVAIAGAAYTATPSRAVLFVDGDYALPRGRYRLLVCDALADLIGATLDGDGDSLAGGDFLRDFGIARTNRIANPNFDSNLAPWFATGTAESDIGFSTADADTAPTSGSALVAALDGALQDYSFSQCVDQPALGGATARVRVDTPTEAYPAALIRLDYYDGPGCSGAYVDSTYSSPAPGDTGGAWVPLVATASPQMGAALSTQVVLVVSGGEVPVYTVEFDHIESIEPAPIFADGFEDTE